MKKDDIVFFTEVPGLPEIESIKYGKDSMPDWFLNTPSFAPHQLNNEEKHIGMGTIRTCPAVSDLFGMAYIIPMWCDFYLNVTEDVLVWRNSNDIFKANTHLDYQFKDHIPEYAKKDIKAVFKPLCPWRIKTPPGISMLQLPASYHFNKDFTVPIGIIDTYIWPELNPQILINRCGEIFIEKGTPLSMLVPIENKRYNTIIREATPEDIKWQHKTYNMHLSKFQNRFRAMKKKLCPYHGK